MLNFFKQSKAETARPTETAALNKTSSKAQERRLLPRPLPVPEVAEGNADSDWSLWQESVDFQDSTMQPGWFPTAPLQWQEGKPSGGSGAFDAFDSVHKNSS